MKKNDNLQLLKERILLYNRNPDDEQLPMLFELVKDYDPRSYEFLIKTQCAYEFHMILESILDKLKTEMSFNNIV